VLRSEPVRQAGHELIERRRGLHLMPVGILQKSGEVMDRVIEPVHRSREFFTQEAWQFIRHTASYFLLVLLPFRQGLNSRSQLGNGQSKAVCARSFEGFPWFLSRSRSTSFLLAVNRGELFQHLLHGLSGKECVHKIEKRVVRVHETKDHRFFDECKQIGDNKSDDGRKKFLRPIR
jgi:hypothetical protein